MLTTAELAAEWKVHPQTIRRWVRLGALTRTRVGSLHRFSQFDVDAFLRRHNGQMPVVPKATSVVAASAMSQLRSEFGNG